MSAPQDDERTARVLRFPDGEPIGPLRAGDRPRTGTWIYWLVGAAAVAFWIWELTH